MSFVVNEFNFADSGTTLSFEVLQIKCSHQFYLNQLYFQLNLSYLHQKSK